MKYITLFETDAAYNAATLDLPNVSLIEENMSVGYKPYVPETRVVCKYNVTDTSSPTQICGYVKGYPPFMPEQDYSSGFTSIEIDGVMMPTVSYQYQFGTIGEHTIKYTLLDPTSIGDSTFYGCSSLTSCTIGNSVTSIGDNAFGGCNSLTSCTIGSGVTSISERAFNDCSSLISITVDSNNTVYDSRNNCNAIIETSTNTLVLGFQNTVIPNSVTSIGESAFNGCSNLTSIVIPDSVTSIGSSTFYGCSSLTSCTIGSGVTSIGNKAFQGCSSLTSIDIPNSVTSIGNRVFYQCTDLTSVTIGSGVTSIGDVAFAGCSSLTSIDIPDSVTSISWNAFQDCSDLTNVIIGSGVTSIGGSAFENCSNLTSITVDSNNTTYDSRNNCNAIIETSTNTLIKCCKTTIIPDSVTSIGNNAFYGCSGLTSIDIPDSVTSIGNSAFYGCSGLTSCTIGSGVTSIGSYAFSGCSSLTSITSSAMTAPTIISNTFYDVKTDGTLTVPSGSTGYDTWMSTGYYFLGKYNWTKVEQ